jgi:hypothetical protein
MGFAIAPSPRVLNKLALQTSHKAASGCKGLFGLVANRVGRAGAWWHRAAAPEARNAPRCRCLPKPRDQQSIKKVRGCDGMHEIRTLLSERMREVRAALGAHARGKTQAAEELGVVMITRMRPKTVMF